MFKYIKTKLGMIDVEGEIKALKDRIEDLESDNRETLLEMTRNKLLDKGMFYISGDYNNLKVHRAYRADSYPSYRNPYLEDSYIEIGAPTSGSYTNSEEINDYLNLGILNRSHLKKLNSILDSDKTFYKTYAEAHKQLEALQNVKVKKTGRKRKSK